MGLKLDYNRLIKDFINLFFVELEVALKAWETEVNNYSMFYRFGKRVESAMEAEVNSYVVKEGKALRGFLEANPAALADAFGTGSLMNIKDNPLYQEYRNSDQWNRARHGKEIVGRPEGTYTDIFGRERHSSGYLEGINLENERLGTAKGKGYLIEPIPPSNSIKIADNFLYNRYLPQAIKNARNKIKLSKYLIEVK